MNKDEIKKTEKKIHKNFSKKEILASLGCVALAFLLGFVIAPLFSRYSSGMVTVVEASTAIPEGTKISSTMLKTVKMSRKNLPSGTIHSINDVLNKYADMDIPKSDIITSAKLSKNNSEYNLKNGKMLMSISVSNIADSLSGKIQKGDIVSVFISANDNGNTDALNPDELKYVEVISATTKSGNDADNNSTSSKSEDDLPATVTLLVNQKQAAILTKYENSSIHLALVSRDDTTKANDLIQQEDNYLNSGSFDTEDTTSAETSSSSENAGSSSQKNSALQDNLNNSSSSIQ